MRPRRVVVHRLEHALEALAVHLEHGGGELLGQPPRARILDPLELSGQALDPIDELRA